MIDEKNEELDEENNEHIQIQTYRDSKMTKKSKEKQDKLSKSTFVSK